MRVFRIRASFVRIRVDKSLAYRTRKRIGRLLLAQTCRSGGAQSRQITSAFGTIRDIQFFNIYSPSTCPDEPCNPLHGKAAIPGAIGNTLRIHAQPCHHSAKKYGGAGGRNSGDTRRT